MSHLREDPGEGDWASQGMSGGDGPDTSVLPGSEPANPAVHMGRAFPGKCLNSAS